MPRRRRAALVPGSVPSRPRCVSHRSHDYRPVSARRMFFSHQVSEDNIMQVWLMAENIYNDQEIDVSEAELEGSQ